ncbi:VOC family protein [Streptomyces sp. LBUM 1478]|nr:VOC family protein [Streptomyces sp. LBUM 1478]
MAVNRLNHAVLFVRDIECSVAFYSQVFGFAVEHEMPGRAAFLRARGSDNDHDLGLFTLGPDAPGPQRDRVGLHHLAWEVGTLGELADTADLLDARRALTGSTDYLVAKSLHGVDPDGHEFEVLWRVPAPTGRPRRRTGDRSLWTSGRRSTGGVPICARERLPGRSHDRPRNRANDAKGTV